MTKFLTTLFCPNIRTGEAIADFAVFTLSPSQAFQLDRLHEETTTFLKACAETDLLSGPAASPTFKSNLVPFQAFKFSAIARESLRGHQFISSADLNDFEFWRKEEEVALERFCLELAESEIRFSASLTMHPGKALLPPLPLRAIQVLSPLGAPPLPLSA